MPKSFVSWWCVVVNAAGLFACGAPDAQEDFAEPVIAQTSEAVTLGCRSDSVAGRLTTCVFRCDWSPPRTGNNWANCRVPSGYVLTGGGAEIDGQGQPGAVIIGSYPASPYNLYTWQAESKDHGVPYSHRLRAYAIGLRITGVSEATLRSALMVKSSSGWGNDPWAETFGLPDGVIIGGGARVVSPEAGNLLTRSLPTAGNELWYAEAKDHGVPSWGMVESYAIVLMQQQFPGIPYLLVGRNVTLLNCPTVGSGYGTATLDYSGPGVLTSIGGEALYGGHGRLIADVYPTLISNAIRVTVRSKDHGMADSGGTCPYGAVIDLQSGTPPPP